MTKKNPKIVKWLKGFSWYAYSCFVSGLIGAAIFWFVLSRTGYIIKCVI